MFGSLGITEMLIIAAIALIFLGPERFPEFAKILARTVRDLRGYVEETKREVTKELRPVRKEIDELSRYDPEDYIDTLTEGVTSSLDEENNGSGYESDDTGYESESTREDGSYDSDSGAGFSDESTGEAWDDGETFSYGSYSSDRNTGNESAEPEDTSDKLDG